MKQRVTSLLLAALLICSLCACGGKSVSAWQEQYDLGVRYLSDGNYEEAIIAFTAAIEIDPKNVDAYLGRANAYLASGWTDDNVSMAEADFEMALSQQDNCLRALSGLLEICFFREDTAGAEALLTKIRQIKPEDLGEENIFHPVDGITGCRIYDKERETVLYLQYDADDNLTDLQFDQLDGELYLWREAFTFNSEFYSRKIFYQYDENGDLLSEKEFCYPENIWEVCEYRSSQLVRDTMYDANGESMGWMDFYYNEEGWREKTETFGPDGKWENTVVYDKDGNIVSTEIDDGF